MLPNQSKTKVLTQLALDSYFDTLLGSSQDPDQTSSRPRSADSSAEKSHIELPRRQHLPLSSAFSDEKPLQTFLPKEKQDHLTPIDKVQARSIQTPSPADLSTRDNTSQKLVLSVPETRKPTPINMMPVELDPELKFNPSSMKMFSDTSPSSASAQISQVSKKKLTQNSKGMSQEVVPIEERGRSGSLDEEEVDMLDQIFEQEAKKSTSEYERHRKESQPTVADRTNLNTQDVIEMEEELGKVELANNSRPSPIGGKVARVEREEEPVLMVARTMARIEIDPKKMAKAAQLFSDNDENVGTSMSVPVEKRIQLNDVNALNKSVEILSDNFLGGTSAIKKSFSTSQNSQISQGSQSRSKLEVKSDTMKKVADYFQKGDEDEEEDFLAMKLSQAFEELRNGKMYEFPVLQTASMKPIQLDPQKVIKAEKLLSQEDDDQIRPVKAQNFGNKTSSPLGFKTGNNKSIQINEEKINQAKRLFADEEADEASPKSLEKVSPQKEVKVPNLMGFKTAAFNSISCNPELLARASKLLADDEDIDERPFSPKPSKHASPIKSQTNNMGFQTAGLKKLVCDPAKLKRAKELFVDEDENDESDSENKFNQLSNKNITEFDEPRVIDQGQDISTGISFKTGNQKKLSVNKEKLQKFMEMFEDDEEEDNFVPSHYSQSKINPASRLVLQKQESLELSQQLIKDKTLKPLSPFKLTTKNPTPISSPNPSRIQLPVEATNRVLSIFEENANFVPQSFSQCLIPEAPVEEPMLKTGAGKKLPVNPSNFSRAQEIMRKYENSNPTKFTGISGTQFVQKSVKAPLSTINENSKPKIEVQKIPIQVQTFQANNNQAIVANPRSLQIQNEQNSMSLLIERERTILTPEESKFVKEEEAETKPTVKKRVLTDLRTQSSTTEASKEFSTLSSKPNSTSFTDINKKITSTNQSFKFTETKNVSQEKEKEKKEPIKRNYESFLETNNFGDQSMNKIISFDSNQKIKQYLTTLKFKKGLKPKNNPSYFEPSNYIKKPRNISRDLIEITITNAISHKFVCPCVDSLNSQAVEGSDIEFECYCDGSLTIGWQELRNALIMKGLKSDYLSEAWVKNHYRMVVWKLASISRRISNPKPNKHLTFKNVKNEIEYRYFIENIQGKRSVLQKVIQKDEMSTSHMVLLVGEIKRDPNKCTVELSDGWYSIYFGIKAEAISKIDKNTVPNNQLMLSLLQKNKIYTGMKVHIAGMKVIKNEGKPEGEGAQLDEKTFIECPSYNSFSRAKWDEKLGLAPTKFFSRSLVSLRNFGGHISMIDVFVVKKYKLLEKTNNGPLKIFEESEEGFDPNKKTFFKLKIADAIVYYDQENVEKYTDLYCEIEVNHLVNDLYNNIKENDRVRFYNLKPSAKADKNFKQFDHLTGKAVAQYLYLQFGKNSVFQNLGSIKSMKEEATKSKEFAKNLFQPNLTLSNLNLTNSLESIYSKGIKSYINEIDVVGVILESDFQKLYAYTSNGNIVKLLIHSRAFFPNIKILDKKDSIVILKNVKIVSMEKIPHDSSLLFNLQTAETSYFITFAAQYKEEVNILTLIEKDKSKKADMKLKLDKLLNRYHCKHSSSDSIDEEMIDQLLTKQFVQNNVQSFRNFLYKSTLRAQELFFIEFKS